MEAMASEPPDYLASDQPAPTRIGSQEPGLTAEELAAAKRRLSVEKAVDTWRSKLVDLTGRNRLIYYRELRTGTLNLQGADSSRVAAMFEGATVRLSRLYRAQRQSHDFGADDVSNPQPFDDATKRIRAIARTGLANLEERGIGTVFLTSHLATWTAGSTSAATPNAPVLLAPLEVRPLGGSHVDFELQLAGEWEVNQTLLIFWSEVFGALLDQDELADLVHSRSGDLNGLADGVLKLARDTRLVPRPEFSDGQLVGNFHYTKLPMVKDLENAIDVLAANDIIAAIAGDPAAQARVREDNSTTDISLKIPDFIPPEDEFLIRDADSSQSHVINTVVAERSVIIEGPPGTGKSQTISNLVASLAARGKSVLFVAEKRAAIEAVLKNLEAVGLADLALDLHTGVIRKKDLAQALSTSLAKMTETTRPRLDREHAELRSLRGQLVDYERELHQPVEPWGQSSFDVNSRLLEFVGTQHIEFDPGAVERLTDEEVVRVAELLERWVANRTAINWDDPWVDVDLSKGDRIEELLDTARLLRIETLPSTADALASAEGELGVDLGTLSLSQLHAMLELCRAASIVGTSFGEQVWDLDLDRTAAALNAKGLFRGGGKEYRDAKRVLKTAQTGRVGKSDRKRIINDAAKAAADWSELGLDASPRDVDIRDALAAMLDAVKSATTQLDEVLPPEIGDRTIEELRSALGRLAESEDVAILVGQTSALRTRLVGEGVQPLVNLFEQGGAHADVVTRILEHSILRGRKRAIDSRNPVLNAFRSEDQHRRARQYTEADCRHLGSAAQRVKREVAERALEARNQHADEDAIVEREAKKKTRHKTLRQLQSEAGHVLTALKPCWMMSPLMVAQSLPAAPLFDYVIFDEASQIRPEEAISAIARGRNLVVAGDRRQLPPSAFFDTTTADIDEYDEEDETVEALTSGYQSILDVTSALLPTKMLTWHYRSRDERLIALSNDHIYEGSLTTFPGTEQASPVTFYRVHHTPTNKEEVKSNPTEVAQVVDRMVEHATTRPHESLGVIAFGQHHASAIDDALREHLRVERSSELDEFFDESRPERVFVKNIERVQGDERDAIILSIGYGKDLNGRVPHRFGPVNQDGGERRINVAASRARSRMAIVSSIGSEDLDTESLGKGPQLLQHLLRFAETRGNDTGAAKGRQNLNPFELAVKFELDKLGLNPICQYGASGFRIDFALAHPDNDGRMVLAVEADGASYHSSVTARDRDRLRQQILEDKGWRFHRIWSTAFFKDPECEAAKVKAAYERALGAEPDRPVAPLSTTPAAEYLPATPEAARPRVLTDVPIDQHPHRELVALVRWITDHGENLLTEAEIKERMKKELGYRSLGSRIDEAFTRAIKSAG